jgi:hypothetical protein
MSRSRTWGRVAGLMMTLAAAVVAVLTFGPLGMAEAAPSEQNTAAVVNAYGQALRAGGSATAFSFKLPGGAACPGDSYHHGYLIFSYVVPLGTEPSSLTFPDNFPSSGADLITVGGTPYVTQATEEYTGAIPSLPGFSWSRYAHDTSDLPPGSYNVGIACAEGLGKVDRYWNTKIDFVATSTDSGGFTWHVLEAVDPATHHSSSWKTILSIVAAVVVVGAVLAVVLGRRPRRRGAEV